MQFHSDSHKQCDLVWSIVWTVLRIFLEEHCIFVRSFACLRFYGLVFSGSYRRFVVIAFSFATLFYKYILGCIVDVFVTICSEIIARYRFFAILCYLIAYKSIFEFIIECFLSLFIIWFFEDETISYASKESRNS